MPQQIPVEPDYLGYGRMVIVDPNASQGALPSPVESTVLNAQVVGSSYISLILLDKSGFTLVSFVIEAITGFGNLTWKIQGSNDGNLWFDLKGYNEGFTKYGSVDNNITAGTGGDQAYVALADAALASFRYVQVLVKAQSTPGFVNIWAFAQ